MKERIKHLAEQCSIDIETFDVDRFAELLIKECVSVVKDHYDDSLPWGGVEDVLKHFGVEE